jgi:D12 class N6 adenine-specific DNA methyltransferase
MASQARDEFRALLAYLGGKRKLCPLIFSLIAGIAAPITWPELVFVDPFSGGGSVALYAKLQGFYVVAADLAERACIVARALIANSSVRLTFEDVLDLYREPKPATRSGLRLTCRQRFPRRRRYGARHEGQAAVRSS